MSKFIGFINQSIKHFFIIDGEYLGDGCNEFKNGLPDSFTDSQLMALLRLYAAAASMTFIETPKRPL